MPMLHDYKQCNWLKGKIPELIYPNECSVFERGYLKRETLISLMLPWLNTFWIT